MIELHKQDSWLINHTQKHGGDWGYYEMYINNGCYEIESDTIFSCDKNIEKSILVTLNGSSMNEKSMEQPFFYTYIDSKLILILDEFSNWEVNNYNYGSSYKKKLLRLAKPYFTKPGIIKFPTDPMDPNSRLKKYKHYWGDVIHNGGYSIIVKYFKNGEPPLVHFN